MVLEVCDVRSGDVRMCPLRSARALIGSGPGTDIVLNDKRVSPRHAELVRGPFGQWWIHDLGSDTGTYLYGDRAQYQVLTSDDEFTIGAFRLRLMSKAAQRLALEHSVETHQPVTIRNSSLPPPPDAAIPKSATLPPSPPARQKLPPAGISAAHLSGAMALSRALMQTEDGAGRRRLLSEFLGGDALRGDSVAIVRVLGPRTARVIEGPLGKGGTGLPLYLSSRLTGTLWQTRKPTCQVLRPNGSPGSSNRSENTVLTCPYLCGRATAGLAEPKDAGCVWGQSSSIRSGARGSRVALLVPVRLEAEFVDALHVELIPERRGPDWCTLVAMVAEAYQQAEIVSGMRSHIRQASGVERELEMAREIQQSLVPQQAHFDTVSQELDVVVGFEPCQWVGGDYADVMPMPDGRVLLAIGDVCGKGLQAALVASSLHTFVRAAVESGPSLPGLFERINRHLCRYLPDHVFVTMAGIAADLDTGELEIVNAGHPPALIGDSCGRVWSLDMGHNIGLGLTDATMVSGVHYLEPNQTLFLYTDGLTEGVNERRVPLGTERLAQLFSRIASAHAQQGTSVMKDALMSGLRGYRGSLLANDDSTFLLARRRVTRLPAGAYR